MFIKTCTRKKDGKVYKTHYLAEGYRDKKTGKVKHKHILSLNKMPDKQLLALKDSLKDNSQIEKVRLENLEIIGVKEYGNVRIFEKLFDQIFSPLLDKKYLAEIKAIVINKIFEPKSKNSLNNWVKQVDLGKSFSDTNNLYEAMDYLSANKEAIEKNLGSGKALKSADVILYDITSTYFEGKGAENVCKFGYSRDHRSDRIQVNIGLVTTDDGLPLSVNVFAGNIADKTTLAKQIENLKEKFNINNVTLIFDRGMKTKANLIMLKEQGYDYITALSHAELKQRAEDSAAIQMSLFDKKALSEFVIDDKKYILCHNPAKQKMDNLTREKLIVKTEEKLIAIQNFKKSYSDVQLQDKVSKIINQRKCEKYFNYEIKNNKLTFLRNQNLIQNDDKFDGFYMIVSTKTELTSEATEKKYKSLQLVEQAFDSVKNHIEIRPIFHYKEERIRGHIFSCFMSYYLLHQFKKKSKELLREHSLDELLTELKCVKKVYFKLDKFCLEKISNLNDIQQKLFKTFQIRLL